MREEFAKWFTAYNDWYCKSENEQPDSMVAWAAWQACWEYNQLKLEDIENAMVAMSDSLGAMANE